MKENKYTTAPIISGALAAQLAAFKSWKSDSTLTVADLLDFLSTPSADRDSFLASKYTLEVSASENVLTQKYTIV